jgi:hypothetical protein
LGKSDRQICDRSMKDPYDPTKAPIGPLGGRSTYRGRMIAHNKKVLARRMQRRKQNKPPENGAQDLRNS